MQLTADQKELCRRLREELDVTDAETIAAADLIEILAAHSAGAQEPVAEIVRWLDFTNKPRFDIKVIDETLEHGAKLYSQPMPQTDAVRDAKRLDWLCEYVVNVRLPLVYGSKDMFWAAPVDDDSGHAPSDLRARIDAEIERLDGAKGE